MRGRPRREVLAGDIGGTHVRLALFAVEEEPESAVGRRGRTVGRPVFELRRRYDTGDYDALLPILRDFLREAGAEPAGACLGIACPLRDQVCRLPNVGWEVRAGELARGTGIPRLRLVNDFDAIGYGVRHLEGDELVVLQEGEPEEEGTVGILGAGTGLGAGILVHDGSGYVVRSSELGHVDFAPRNPVECQLLLHLSEKYGRVSYERVLSGPGIVDSYEFLRQDGFAPEDPEVREEMDAGDPAAVIGRRGMEGSDPLCRRAVEIFVAVYGAQAANFALAVQAEGGIYLAGGIAPKLEEALDDDAFIEAFRAKGRLREWMERIPVRLVMNEDVGLLGAARVAAGARRA